MFRKILYLIGITIVIIASVTLFRYIFSTKIRAEFVELRPFRGQASVYYRGFKVGHTVGIRPSKDYKFTYVDIVLYPANPPIPANVTAELRKKTVMYKFQHDFIELEIPSSPSVRMLQNFDVIEGITTMDVKDYFASQNPKTLDDMKEDLSRTINNLDQTISLLGDLFQTLNDTVAQSQRNVVNITENIEKTSKNLSQMSSKLNNSVTQDGTANTARNLEETSEYIKETTKNLSEITRDLSEQTPEITSAIKSTNEILNSASQITGGVNNTLQKRFGTLRLLFGKPVSK